MNKWIEKSIKLAEGNFYLDKLLDIYPPENISRGIMVEKEVPELKKLFEERNCKEVVKKLIYSKKKLKFKFPIENPYIGFLSSYEEAIDKNPKTLKRICDELFKMNYEELTQKMEAPKKASRRIGPMFKSWLKNRNEFLGIEDFGNSNKLTFLDGGDNLLKEYAITKLGCNLKRLSKGLDFIANIKDKYIVGTAKFITDAGGSQDNQFYEAIRFIKETKCPINVTKVAVVDGVAWLCKNMRKVLQKIDKEKFCFSALLLEEFINEEILK